MPYNGGICAKKGWFLTIFGLIMGHLYPERGGIMGVFVRANDLNSGRWAKSGGGSGAHFVSEGKQMGCEGVVGLVRIVLRGGGD